MAQGLIKKANKAPAKKNSSKTAPRGSRVIKPKKPALISQQKIVKKRSAGLAAMTEKSLGEKAGHLEMLRGGKKDKKEASAKANAAHAKANGYSK
ncbi:hypothetical protein GQ43DRAFT_443002 [Delitschia confertaspora ATCC 74209]|uniref:Uncharacterized protein n=1 Tax=Delitschia confertaspora ATCC 74209 TaxID=1513339 RepID=A0A9P4JIS4_9PLEO|nr:hypothetical protein GQ43DRAFT_443002 [Delitschia confertaspora ATCC 74209]